MTTSKPKWNIECNKISKSFGGAIALNNADFSCRYGEIHALLGENGAGKSTLVKILTGAVKPDAGEIRINDKLMEYKSVKDGLSGGVGAVFQELSLMPDLTVTENILFGREKCHLGIIDKKEDIKIVERLFKEFHVEGISPNVIVRLLPISTQQVIEIVKVLSRNPKILILDEATAALTREATLWLFDLLHEQINKGVAVLFISHRINEVLQISDRITVFRNGQTKSTGKVGEYSEESLVETMLGRILSENHTKTPLPIRDAVVFEVSDLDIGDCAQTISFKIRAGEILGLGGLQGQGQYDLLLSLYGYRPSKGNVKLNGKNVEIRSPKTALANGITLIPQDRRSEGLMMGQSIRENLVLPSLRRLTNFGWLPVKKEQAFVKNIANEFNFKAPSLEYDVQTLSGGNQQKVLVGKLLPENLEILLLADITRGIDVGTRADMYRMINKFAERGIAIIIYSSDSSELCRLCHRVAVMYDRSFAVILEGNELTEENLIRAAVGFSINKK